VQGGSNHCYFKWEPANSMRDNADITRTVQVFGDTVLRVCTLYFGGKPDRDDAFQETFLKYAHTRQEFVDDEHRKAWLIRVATNVCKDMLKQSSAKIVLLDQIDETARPEWDQREEGARQAYELTCALKKLDDKYRITLYLKYYEGYSAPEIAETLDMPENTVYTNLARGREKLKEVLNRDEERAERDRRRAS